MENNTNQQELEKNVQEIKEAGLENVSGGTIVLPPAIDEPIRPNP